ncbi:helix-turn-helix transcriptional regulator [Sphingomonas sp. GC_Shp_2]|nr:helix-turn-helix transcriptional regulator [Sphingomonas sp. GC_Shp_2]
MFNRIGTLRKAHGLSRRDVAIAVGVNPQTIGCLERGDYAPSLELGMAIARLLARPVEAVFSADPFPDDAAPDPAALRRSATGLRARSVRATPAAPDGGPTAPRYPPRP